MPTDPTDSIEPLVPIMPTTPTTTDRPLTDGGDRPHTPPPRTDHATEYDRDTEEILPLVPDLR